MARDVYPGKIIELLAAAESWIQTCLIGDGSLFSRSSLWNPQVIEEVRGAFVDHPDHSAADFMTKLKGQMKEASPVAQQLAAEMLWALLLFPSNIRASTKRRQIKEIWSLSGGDISDGVSLLRDVVLQGVGSGGPGFNNYRPEELRFLIGLAADLKARDAAERERIFLDYETFIAWIGSVPRNGLRQFRHMLRYFAFPDRVERISSNNDRRTILESFGVASNRETKNWSDDRLDDAMGKLRTKLQAERPGRPLDFYEPELKSRWSPDHRVKTLDGVRDVVVPSADEEDAEDQAEARPLEARQSLQMQAKLADIGIAMDFKIWLPRPDRTRVVALMSNNVPGAILDDLPLSYDAATTDTIALIDVIWIKNRSIVRAFEVEHTTAVYSGLLRMADLLALQPNIRIDLHIVAPDERREKVFREMLRPVFALLDQGPLSSRCTFLSYDSVNEIRDLRLLAHLSPSVIEEYEEPATTE